MTGYWESRAFRGKPDPSPVQAQISQAGGVAVVWFTRPPTGFTYDYHFTLPDGTGETEDWVYGVGVVVVRSLDGSNLLERGTSLKWIAALQPAPDPFNTLDPSHLDKPPTGMRTIQGTGELKLIGNGFTMNFGGHAQIAMSKLRDGARLPRAVIDTVPAPLHTTLLTDTVRVVPHQIEHQMLSLFAPDYAKGTPRMAELLEKWHRSKGISGKSSVESRHQVGVALTFGLDEPWRTSLLDRVALAARTNVLPLGGTTKTYSQWLNEVLAEEEFEVSKARTTDSKRVQDAIRALRPGGADAFAYTLTFTDDAGIKGKAGVNTAGIFVSIAKVTKEALVLKRDKHGNIEYDSEGRAQVADNGRKELPWLSPSRLYGVMVKADVGISNKDYKEQRDLAKGKSPDPSKWYDHGQTADLGSVEFRSSLDIPRVEDFDRALFMVTTLAIGEVKFGIWAKAAIADSSLWELRLTNGIRMSAIVDSPVFKGPDTSNSGSIFSTSWWKDWKPSGVEITAFRVSLGYGTLLSPASWIEYQKAEKVPDKGSTNTLSESLTAEIKAFFEYDSFVLEDPKKPELSPMPRRLLLEQRLAEIRGILMLSGPPLTIVGMTSPEGKPEYNQILSHNRTLAVKQAIEDAFGLLYPRQASLCVPLGEKPSLAPRGTIGIYQGVTVAGGGLIDPELYSSLTVYFSDPNRRKRADEWPQWRRVDIFLSGFLLVTVFAKPDPTPLP